MLADCTVQTLLPILTLAEAVFIVSSERTAEVRCEIAERLGADDFPLFCIDNGDALMLKIVR